jgi:hypothetical protein
MSIVGSKQYLLPGTVTPVKDRQLSLMKRQKESFRTHQYPDSERIEKLAEKVGVSAEGNDYQML